MIKHILKYGLFTACISLLLVNLSSCNEENSGGGVPEILGVRITNPDNADSTFVQSNTGQWIAVIGRNLQGVQKAYINDQSIGFNPTYNTTTSLLLQIPNERDMTKNVDLFNLLYTYDGGVLSIKPGTIRLETSHGVATYEFTVMGGSPSVTKVEAEVYPTPTGGKVTVNGTDFVNIKRIYFSDISPDSINADGTKPNAKIIEVPAGWKVASNRYLDPMKGYVVQSVLTFGLPDLPRTDGNYFGYVAVECPTGTTSIKFSTLPSPIVESVSSDMPIVGTKLTLHGQYFVDIEQININNGEIVIPAGDMEITRTSISFIMPDKPTNPKNNPLKIVARAGEVTLANFYPYQNVLLDLSTKGRDQNWGPNAAYQEANSADPPYISDGRFAQIKGTTVDWWGPMVYWDFAPATGNTQVVFPGYDVIPAATPTTDVYLSYECYNMIPFSLATTGGATIRYSFNTSSGAGYGPNFNYLDYAYLAGPVNVVLPGVDGQPLLNQWYQVLIPLSRFGGLESATYGKLAEGGVKEFMLQLQHQNGPQGSVNVCFDNFRIVTKLKSAQ